MTPDFIDFFRVFGRIGVLSFGGPAAQIALMHKELVADRAWLSDRDFLGALSFCMLLPGPEAMQLATYTGWKLRGVLGGLLAGLLFVLPGALVILALALLYITYGDLPLVQAGFLGIKAAVVAIVLLALWKVSQKALHGPFAWAIAISAFAAIFAFNVSFVVIIALAAAIGSIALRSDAPAQDIAPVSARAGQALQVPIWLALWVAPIGVVYALDHSFLLDIALFFSKLAVVTFGGAYAVLAYMAQTVSQDFGWISLPEMMDALGLAETTPGPLILVTEFVGLLAGHKEGGLGMMLLAGALTLWCTFVPCFLWIFAAAPYVDRLLAQPALKAALSGISAAVVGVILNLSIWFALHVLFSDVAQTPFGARPIWQSFDPIAALLTVGAGVVLLGLRWSLPQVLLISTAAALGFSLL